MRKMRIGKRGGGQALHRPRRAGVHHPQSPEEAALHQLLFHPHRQGLQGLRRSVRCADGASGADRKRGKLSMLPPVACWREDSEGTIYPATNKRASVENYGCSFAYLTQYTQCTRTVRIIAPF